MSLDYSYKGDMRPYNHQLKTIRFMLKNKRAYLFLDIGLGKSATCLWFSDMLYSKGKIKKVLIVTPLSTMYCVWLAEVNKMTNLKAVVVHGTRDERLQALDSNAQVFITNTDAVRNYEDELTKLKADILIIDEITDFANHSSKRSKAMARIASKTYSAYGLSGSPVAGGLMNSFGIAKIINPSSLPTQYISRYRSMIMYQINMYEYIPKECATDIVNQTLRPAIRFSKEECLDIPDITIESRMVSLPKETMTLFKDMYDHQIAEYKKGIITASTAGIKLIRLFQILTGCTKTEEGEYVTTNIDPKLKELLQIYHESGNKLIIFSQSVKSTEIIHKYLNSKGVDCDRIYGNTSIKVRSKIIDKFQSTDSGALVAQYKTMSHGITLTKGSTIVFFGVVFGNEALQQCIGRIRRMGQRNKQTVIKLLSTKLEEKFYKKLDATNNLANELLDLYNSPCKER